MSQKEKKEQGTCTVCMKEVVIQLNGLIFIHGPRNSRCAGSNQPPTTSGIHSGTVATAQEATTTTSDININNSKPLTQTTNNNETRNDQFKIFYQFKIKTRTYSAQ